jgi:hypothetical protein
LTQTKDRDWPSTASVALAKRKSCSRRAGEGLLDRAALGYPSTSLSSQTLTKPSPASRRRRCRSAAPDHDAAAHPASASCGAACTPLSSSPPSPPLVIAAIAVHRRPARPSSPYALSPLASPSPVVATLPPLASPPSPPPSSPPPVSPPTRPPRLNSPRARAPQPSPATPRRGVVQSCSPYLMSQFAPNVISRVLAPLERPPSEARLPPGLL